MKDHQLRWSDLGLTHWFYNAWHQLTSDSPAVKYFLSVVAQCSLHWTRGSLSFLNIILVSIKNWLNSMRLFPTLSNNLAFTRLTSKELSSGSMGGDPLESCTKRLSLPFGCRYQNSCSQNKWSEMRWFTLRQIQWMFSLTQFREMKIVVVELCMIRFFSLNLWCEWLPTCSIFRCPLLIWQRFVSLLS